MEATPHLLLFLSPRGANLSTAYQKMVCLTKEKAHADSVARGNHIGVIPGSGIVFYAVSFHKISFEKTFLSSHEIYSFLKGYFLFFSHPVFIFFS